MVNNTFPDSVVITGVGWVTPSVSGHVAEVLVGLKQVASQSREGDSLVSIPESAFVEFEGVSKEIRSDRTSWLAASALVLACADAGIELADIAGKRTGLVLGTALAGQAGMITFANDVRKQSARFVSPIHFPQTVGNYQAGALTRQFKIDGPNETLANGSASGLDAVCEAVSFIHSGVVDIVLAGGADSISQPLLAAFGSSVHQHAEGACFFVLESAKHARQRNARVYGRFIRPDECNNVKKKLSGHVAENVVVSSVPASAKGEIDISCWTGHCFGALGAMALAALLGYQGGEAVPILQADSGHRVEHIQQQGRSELPFAAMGCVRIVPANGSKLILSVFFD